MYHLQILTPEKIFFDDEIIALSIPGDLGYLGILKDHAPLITTLNQGIVIITDKNNAKHFYKVPNGFFEVQKNKAVLLVETIEDTSSIESSQI